jgi:hypothetical protein
MNRTSDSSPMRGRLLSLYASPDGWGTKRKRSAYKQKQHPPGDLLAGSAWAAVLIISYLRSPEGTHAPFVQHVQRKARFWDSQFTRSLISGCRSPVKFIFAIVYSERSGQTPQGKAANDVIVGFRSGLTEEIDSSSFGVCTSSVSPAVVVADPV